MKRLYTALAIVFTLFCSLGACYPPQSDEVLIAEIEAGAAELESENAELTAEIDQLHTDIDFLQTELERHFQAVEVLHVMGARVTCSDVQAASIGIRVVSEGHPLYRFMRDGDGDGTVCEETAVE